MSSKILTKFQEEVLTTLFDNKLGERGYYLTGGTALSEFYLQHRYSDDLDFFTRTQVNLKSDFEKFREILIGHFEITSEVLSDDYARYFVREQSRDVASLKIEFAKDVPAVIDRPVVHGNIVVDSFEDIAVNKVCAILGRGPSEPKDYVDLYFILKESNYSMDYLVNLAREKEASLDHEEGVLIFATNLLSVDDSGFRPLFEKLKPKMVKALTLDKLKEHLVPIAHEIIQRLRPGRE